MTRDPTKSTTEELEEVEREIATKEGELIRLKERAKSLRSDYAREGW